LQDFFAPVPPDNALGSAVVIGVYHADQQVTIAEPATYLIRALAAAILNGCHHFGKPAGIPVPGNAIEATLCRFLNNVTGSALPLTVNAPSVIAVAPRRGGLHGRNSYAIPVKDASCVTHHALSFRAIRGLGLDSRSQTVDPYAAHASGRPVRWRKVVTAIAALRVAGGCERR